MSQYLTSLNSIMNHGKKPETKPAKTEQQEQEQQEQTEATTEQQTSENQAPAEASTEEQSAAASGEQEEGEDAAGEEQSAEGSDEGEASAEAGSENAGEEQATENVDTESFEPNADLESLIASLNAGEFETSFENFDLESYEDEESGDSLASLLAAMDDGSRAIEKLSQWSSVTAESLEHRGGVSPEASGIIALGVQQALANIDLPDDHKPEMADLESFSEVGGRMSATRDMHDSLNASAAKIAKRGRKLLTKVLNYINKAVDKYVHGVEKDITGMTALLTRVKAADGTPKRKTVNIAGKRYLMLGNKLSKNSDHQAVVNHLKALSKDKRSSVAFKAIADAYQGKTATTEELALTNTELEQAYANLGMALTEIHNVSVDLKDVDERKIPFGKSFANVRQSAVMIGNVAVVAGIPETTGVRAYAIDLFPTKDQAKLTKKVLKDEEPTLSLGECAKTLESAINIAEALGGINRGFSLVLAAVEKAADTGDKFAKAIDSSEAGGVELARARANVSNIQDLSKFAKNPMSSLVSHYTGVYRAMRSYVESSIRDHG